MASPTINILRYGALVAGIFYGIVHQRTLYKKAQEYKDSQEYAHKETLIRQAKNEWKKRSSPPSGVITDPDDSRFDLEKFLQHLAEQKQ